MKGDVTPLFRVETGHTDVMEFIYRPDNPQGERRKHALQSYSAFTYYHVATGENQRYIGQKLLIDLTMFFRLMNAVEDKPEEEGLAENPFLTTLRKHICGEGPLLDKLPEEVYCSLN